MWLYLTFDGFGTSHYCPRPPQLLLLRPWHCITAVLLALRLFFFCVPIPRGLTTLQEGKITPFYTSK